jgi:hypothetical protein
MFNTGFLFSFMPILLLLLFLIDFDLELLLLLFKSLFNDFDLEQFLGSYVTDIGV